MSELELLVQYDMYENGYDPHIREDIEAYWRMRLDD